MGTPASCTHVVLHVDVDAFFCQVEALRHIDGELRGVPLAVQQHQDIIAVDYKARQAGVQKHMAPAEARRLLTAVGGRVVHVYCEDGTRPSYRPYRETSAALMRLLRGLLPPGAVLEKASIDEAYVALPAPPPGSLRDESPSEDVTAADVPEDGDGAQDQDVDREGLPADPWVRQAWRLGELIRRQALAQLGLRVSVGLAPNKLLAKLASRAAKPDGLRAVLRAEQVQQVLHTTPITRLPGMGGRVAEALAAAGYGTAAQLRQLSAAELAALCGLRPAAAAQLAAWARGEDPRPVAERGPPAAIQVQMTLTPVPRPAHPELLARAVTAGPNPVNLGTAHPGPAHDESRGDGGGGGGAEAAAPRSPSGASGGMLLPLVPSSPEGRVRLERLVRSMAGDLVARVLLDRHQERRWPSRLTVWVMAGSPKTHGSAAVRTAAKTCAFPSPSLEPARQAAADGGAAPGARGAARAHSAASHGAGVSAPVAAGAAAAAVPEGAGGHHLIVGEHTFYQPGRPSALLEAVAANALSLCGLALGSSSQGLPLVQIHLTAHSFKPLSAAGAAGAIAPFLVHRTSGARGGGGSNGAAHGGSAQHVPPQPGGGGGQTAGGGPASLGQAVRPVAAAEAAVEPDDGSPTRPARKRVRRDQKTTDHELEYELPPARQAPGVPAGAGPPPLEPDTRAGKQSHPPQPGSPPKPIHPAHAQLPQPKRPALQPPRQPVQQALPELGPPLQPPPQPPSRGTLPARDVPPPPAATAMAAVAVRPLPEPPPLAPRRPVRAGPPHQRARIPPARIDLPVLLSKLWPDPRDEEEGLGGGVSRDRSIPGAQRNTGSSAHAMGVPDFAGEVAEKAIQRMDAWLMVFGAPSLEEWWNGM